jgi:hypothetical protein
MDVALVALMLGALVLIPLGLPGLWVQVAAAAGLAARSPGIGLPWGWVAGFAALAVGAEVIEFVSGQGGAKRFGGSRRAGLGALVGGIAGAIVGGFGIPIVGNVLMSFVGTFVGAVLGEMSARGRLAPELRVGFGAVVGRAVGVAAKVAVGVALAVVTLWYAFA